MNEAKRVCFRISVASCLAIFLFGLCSFPNQTNAQEKKKPDVVRLPEETDEPVLEFDTVGGFRMANPREFTPTPRLSIFADGRIVCGRPDPRFAEVEYQMPKDELMKLLEFVVNEQGFFSITRKKIDTQITESGRRVLIADAPTSLFSVNVARGSHRCEVYAVDFVVTQFADIPELQRIARIQKRLMKLSYRAQLGSENQMTGILKAVNDALKKKSPKAKQLTLDDIQFAAAMQDKSFKVVFHRNDRDEEGNYTESINVEYLRATPEAEPELNASVRPIARR